MNERIRELIEQSTTEVNNPWLDSDGNVVSDCWEESIDLNQFAELIKPNS